MAIATTDLILYGAAVRPVDDVVTGVGGAITLQHRPEFVQMVANGTVEVLSSAAGDTTQVATLIGRNAAGALVTDTKTLTGTTPIAFTGTFERVLRVTLSGTAVGTVTVRRVGNETLGTIPIGELGFYAMFHDSASAAGIVIRAEKMFFRNSHATLTLNAADVTLTVDPDSRIRIGLDLAINGTLASTGNRTVMPVGITFSDDSAVLTVPGGVLPALAGIGVWVEQNLPASDPAHRSSYTTRLRGTST
jgi:hypothetical protein